MNIYNELTISKFLKPETEDLFKSFLKDSIRSDIIHTTCLKQLAITNFAKLTSYLAYKAFLCNELRQYVYILSLKV